MTGPSVGLWRQRSFRWVIGGETVSLIGDGSFQIVLAWLVLTMSGSPATLAGVLVAAAVPRGILLLLGGVVTDAVTAVGEQIGGLVSPVVGGLLLAVTTPTTALAFNTITFVFAAATIATAPARARRHQPAGARRASFRDVLGDLRLGVVHAAGDPGVHVVLLLVSAATLSYSGLFAVGLPAFARDYPNGSFVLGALVSAWGLGQLTGAVLAGFTGLPRRWGLLIIIMTVLEAATFAILGFVPDYLVGVALLAALGVGVAYSTDVALPTFVQSQTSSHLLGRINSIINLPRVALEPVSIAGLGLLLQIDLRLAFVVAAVPMALVGIRLALSPTARRLSSPSHRHDMAEREV